MLLDDVDDRRARVLDVPPAERIQARELFREDRIAQGRRRPGAEIVRVVPGPVPVREDGSKQVVVDDVSGARRITSRNSRRFLASAPAATTSPS
jgi:hypothetical protein